MIRNEEGDLVPQFVINPANYRRYTPYVELLEAMDTKQLVENYHKYYSLFQEAYGQMGYADAEFNDRLGAVIDELLATPDVSEPVEPGESPKPSFCTPTPIWNPVLRDRKSCCEWEVRTLPASNSNWRRSGKPYKANTRRLPRRANPLLPEADVGLWRHTLPATAIRKPSVSILFRH